MHLLHLLIEIDNENIELAHLWIIGVLKYSALKIFDTLSSSAILMIVLSFVFVPCKDYVGSRFYFVTQGPGIRGVEPVIGMEIVVIP